MTQIAEMGDERFLFFVRMVKKLREKWVRMPVVHTQQMGRNLKFKFLSVPRADLDGTVPFLCLFLIT